MPEIVRNSANQKKHFNIFTFKNKKPVDTLILMLQGPLGAQMKALDVLFPMVGIKIVCDKAPGTLIATKLGDTYFYARLQGQISPCS